MKNSISRMALALVVALAVTGMTALTPDRMPVLLADGPDTSIPFGYTGHVGPSTFTFGIGVIDSDPAGAAAARLAFQNAVLARQENPLDSNVNPFVIEGLTPEQIALNIRAWFTQATSGN
jgi:hypothetical protein